ncbi:MAG: long-chain fatty acid--CoA ligase, partial [Mycobacteriaceae bacterium]|nr:long-chain fatty acid--CoA ligase [Mycobacteriaceae bacterium]
MSGADLQAFADRVVADLTGPGGRFEMTSADVLGAAMPVMRHRGSSLAETLRASEQFGDREYLVTSGRRISYAEHAAAALALAAALSQRHGVRKGDRIGILAA